MKKTVVLVCGVLAIGWIQASELLINSGTVRVDSTLQADRVNVGSAAVLAGTGTVSALLDVAGVVSPGMPGSNEAVQLTVSSAIVFRAGSRLNLHATTHTNLDSLYCNRAVTGTSQVYISKSSPSVPLAQPVIVSSVTSLFNDFSPGGTNAADWRLEQLAPGLLAVTDLKGDSDGDLLPDYWEVQYFVGRTNAQASGDNDLDSVNNLAEYIAGTVPTNVASVFEIQALTGPSTWAVVQWSSVSGRTYTVGRSINGISGSYTTVLNGVAATPPINAYTDSVSAASVFYKIWALKP